MNFIRRIIKFKSKEDKFFYSELKELLSFCPKEISCYKKSFVHKSLKLSDKDGNPINYERLEFLGDAILGSIIASYLYKKVPEGAEGYLTQMRSKIVSREHLNELGKDLSLIKFFKGKITEKKIGKNIYGNIFEALIGAIYLDRGYNYCEKFIYQKVIIPYVDIDRLERKIISYKGLIIEWCQKQKKEYVFDTYEDSRSKNSKFFSVKINIDGVFVAKGKATSKKKAEEQAAKRMFFAMQNEITKS